MMIRLSKKNEKMFFLVSSANWEAVVCASDTEEAAAIAIEEASMEFEKDLCLSPTITVFNVNDICMDENLDPDLINLFYTPTVLANAGMHSLAKKYSKVIGLMSKNDTNDFENFDNIDDLL